MPPTRRLHSKPVVKGAQSIVKVLDLLELFAQRPAELPLADVAAAMKIPKSTAHRLLSALSGRGYVRQAWNGGPYGLGPRVVALANAYNASQPIARVALPHMEALRAKLDETVGLYVRLNESSRVLIERLESTHAMQVVMVRGVPMPLHLGAGGRVLANESSDARKASVIVTREERVPNACGIAAPIFDNAGALVAALDVAGPLDRFTPKAIERYSRAVGRAAAAISRDLGYRPSSERVRK